MVELRRQHYLRGRAKFAAAARQNGGTLRNTMVEVLR